MYKEKYLKKQKELAREIYEASRVLHEAEVARKIRHEKDVIKIINESYKNYGYMKTQDMYRIASQIPFSEKEDIETAIKKQNEFWDYVSMIEEYYKFDREHLEVKVLNDKNKYNTSYADEKISLVETAFSLVESFFDNDLRVKEFFESYSEENWLKVLGYAREVIAKKGYECYMNPYEQFITIDESLDEDETIKEILKDFEIFVDALYNYPFEKSIFDKDLDKSYRKNIDYSKIVFDLYPEYDDYNY